MNHYILLCRCSEIASPQNSVSLFKQSNNTVIAGSESVFRNNTGLESTADWSSNITTPVVKSETNVNITTPVVKSEISVNITTPVVKNETSNTASRINVETLLHTNETHQLKKKALVQDTLPGIINKFG